MLPTTTAFAAYGDLDLAGIWSAFETEIGKLGNLEAQAGIRKAKDDFEKKTGLEWDKTLSSFGGEFGLVITLDDSRKITLPTGGDEPLQFPEPGILIIVKVRDNTIFDRIDALMSANPQVIKPKRTG